MNWLVVVTFLAGTTWGPAVQITPMPSASVCAVMRASMADEILKTSATNVVGGGRLTQDNGDSVITGNSGRQMARISCKSGNEVGKVTAKSIKKQDAGDDLRVSLSKE